MTCQNRIFETILRIIHKKKKKKKQQQQKKKQQIFSKDIHQ